MKTLILNGSPRRHGDTAALLDELKKHLAGEVMVVSAYHDHIGPCVDCRYCWKHDGCAIGDGMQAVYQALEDADNIVIASPLYFSQLTGPLLSLASRLQRYYAARRFRGEKPFAGKRKRGVLILAGGGDGKETPAVEMAGILFRHVNARFVGMALSHYTDETPAAKDTEALEKVRELALVLNEGGHEPMVEFRLATLEDAEVLADLRMEMLFERKQAEVGFRELLRGNTVKYLREAMDDSSYAAWVAVECGAIVAMGGLTFYRLPPNDWCPDGRTAYLSAMYTKPAHRKNGIAKRLLELLMREARDRGCERILLHATEMGRPLYDAAGFRDSADSMAFYPNLYHD